MINKVQNNLLSQMQALESMAQGQTLKLEQKTDETTSFSSMMQQAINQVNDTQMHASQLTKAFEMGDSNLDISEVMIAVQKSSVSFQALTEVRNKLLTAYQDVMNMPV
ncbi:MAG: flagellar hook-basal body complex protein FliE [Gammaproteobacteria bacterium]|nr:flagellar hook-basal body complex protein FliE [Gammaproteobacteria bacterium]